ncbi:hypothetical protein PPGU19_059790 (plasmid) [Paraburkholderia sp. PGU19]|nr:hypothetical protein PPGU19_059790 [Paraburkholderia sp. PGU19]
MHDRAMLNPNVSNTHVTRSARPPQNASARVRDPHSTFRALQALPLARLAANGTDHAHVRAVAILGYN